MGTKRKKLQKKSGARGVSSAGDFDAAELMAEIPPPAVRDLLPWQMVRLTVATIIFIPFIPKHVVQFLADRKQRQIEEKERLITCLFYFF